MHNENQKCALIDRADPDTGEIVPIEGWNKNRTKKIRIRKPLLPWSGN